MQRACSVYCRIPAIAESAGRRGSAAAGLIPRYLKSNVGRVSGENDPCRSHRFDDVAFATSPRRLFRRFALRRKFFPAEGPTWRIIRMRVATCQFRGLSPILHIVCDSSRGTANHMASTRHRVGSRMNLEREERESRNRTSAEICRAAGSTCGDRLASCVRMVSAGSGSG